MEKKRKIVQYRERLDKTLASPDLTNEQMLKSLVKSQLLRSSQQEIEECNEKLVETKTAEISKVLDMLRSASIDDSRAGGSSTSHTDWKLKQDNEEFRVMYREGPEGTPFHTLLVEGYVDGPVDVYASHGTHPFTRNGCVCKHTFQPLDVRPAEAIVSSFCISKSILNLWDVVPNRWPQSTVPSFKIIASECLQKVQIGEQIGLIRMKVSWPLSTREAIVHYYLFEYFQDDLVLVILNSVSDSKSINGTINGFNNDAIPEAKGIVRIDLVGGFVVQKVTSERSYFRTIANMDIKLDIVPPSLINFISRQLIGSGFRLYQKAVASMRSHDQELNKALEDPLYVRIREALYSISGSKDMDGEELKQVPSILPAEDLIQSKQDGAKDISWEDKNNQNANNFNSEIVEEDIGEIVEEDNGEIVEEDRGEIVEADSEEIVQIEEDDKKVDDIPNEEVDIRNVLKDKRNVYMSSEVKLALETLDRAISMVRKYGFHPHKSASSSANEESRCMEEGGIVDSYSAKPSQQCSKNEFNVQVSNSIILEETSQEPGSNSGIQNFRITGTNPNLKEVNYNKVVPASPEQNLSRPIEASQVLAQTRCDYKPLNTDAVQDMSLDDPKNSKSNSLVTQSISSDVQVQKQSSRQKKYRYCCFLH